ANTGIVLGAPALQGLLAANGVGIVAGLVLGKPLGIALACLLAVKTGLCRLPAELRWSHLAGAGMLGGIGFTMSIFIANLAFPHDTGLVDASKGAVLLGSAISALFGLAWLR